MSPGVRTNIVALAVAVGAGICVSAIHYIDPPLRWVVLAVVIGFFVGHLAQKVAAVWGDPKRRAGVLLAAAVLCLCASGTALVGQMSWLLAGGEAEVSGSFTRGLFPAGPAQAAEPAATQPSSTRPAAEPRAGFDARAKWTTGVGGGGGGQRPFDAYTTALGCWFVVMAIVVIALARLYRKTPVNEDH